MKRLTLVEPEQTRSFTPEEFTAYAPGRWRDAKTAYDDAFNAMAGLHRLMHRPGQIDVLGTVTGARYEARRLRDAADRMVIELDAIITAGKDVTKP